MTPRERVYQALQFKDTDIVPYTITFTTGAHQRLAEYFGDPDFDAKIGNHLARFSHRKMVKWTQVKPGYFQDEWGVVWNRTVDKDIGVVDNMVLPEPTVSDLKLPDPGVLGLAEAYPDFITVNQDRFRLASIGFALFERAWSLRGMGQILMDMIESPDFVHNLFDRITEVNMAHLDIALAQDVDCVYFGDDWGSQSGLIMGPALWREFIKPRVAKMYKRVRDADKYVAIHSCGDVKSILPDLVEIGLNIFNPFQPETMEVYETKRKYHGQLSFYGGISVQNLLPHGTPDDVRRETKRLLSELGKGGGFIASPSHDVPVDVPPENMAALIEVLQNQ
ncbi:MAG: uroporphyrinogen decarboxylase family protein [Armatimonadota bacterium]